MVYKKRLDGRKDDELRPIEAKAGVIANAQGSGSFRIGKTWALAAVYGPRELFPKFLQDPKKGILRCYYNMMPFSGSGERIRPGGNRRAQEIAMVMSQALQPVVDLSAFPNAVVDVFIELPQTVAVSKVDDKIVADLDYREEHIEEFNPESAHASVSDIPVAMINNTKEITLLQMDGEISQKDLIAALELAKEATSQIYEVQKKALKERFAKE